MTLLATIARAAFAVLVAVNVLVIGVVILATLAAVAAAVVGVTL